MFGIRLLLIEMCSIAILSPSSFRFYFSLRFVFICIFYGILLIFLKALVLDKSFFLLGSSSLTKLQNGCQKERVSMCYPFHLKRKTIREFFGGRPLCENMVKRILKLNPEFLIFTKTKSNCVLVRKICLMR